MTTPPLAHPRILFIGDGTSSHTHSWVGLLDPHRFNVRLLAYPPGAPPADWPVRTYLCLAAPWTAADPETRRSLWPHRFRPAQFLAWAWTRAAPARADARTSRWLANIIRHWRPHIVHTFGLEFAGNFYYDLLPAIPPASRPRWVLQLRGGSDLTLTRHDPDRRQRIARVVSACDLLLSDNQVNHDYLRQMDVDCDPKTPSWRTVPGTGGIDIDAMAAGWQGKTSARRLILWPKGFECVWSKSLPVLEALRLCWNDLGPCQLVILAADPETRAWFATLPENIRAHTTLHDRIPRPDALRLMQAARVMLAPSLIDGTPNSLFEAMAAGAVPILSPLDTIRPIVEDRRNVLLARNLYPAEIADALRLAMRDDALVDRIAQENLRRVRDLADRTVIAQRIADLYTAAAQPPF